MTWLNQLKYKYNTICFLAICNIHEMLGSINESCKMDWIIGRQSWPYSPTFLNILVLLTFVPRRYSHLSLNQCLFVSVCLLCFLAIYIRVVFLSWFCAVRVAVCCVCCVSCMNYSLSFNKLFFKMWLGKRVAYVLLMQKETIK